MYYLKGIAVGLALLFLIMIAMYLASQFNLGSVIELLVYLFMLAVLAVLGFKFKSKTGFSLMQLMQPENIKYIYFPFGISTVTAISQAFFSYATDGESFVFWIIPLGVIGQGLGLSMFILIGMWLNRKNA